MDKVIIAEREDKGTKYCILKNDGVGLCVCKHRPCEQLQRAKAEIEELKKQLKNNETAYHTELSIYNMECGNLLEKNKTLIAKKEKLIDQNFKIAQKYTKLEQENERLKKQYNCYACDSCDGKEDYINMKRHTENAIKTVHKYRQALQEIMDIVDKAYYTEDYMLGQRFTELVDAINLTITNIGAE